MSVAERDDRLHRALWRLHFYAGLFCIPFIVWLAVTGSIYAFKPQIDALIDRPYDDLTIAGRRATAAEQIGAAIRAIPGSTFNGYELPRTRRSAVRVLVGSGSDVIRVYVQPQTLRILKIVPEESRFEAVVSHLHGELLLGDRGSMIVELAASWAIVMILTGLYLWWPRGASGLGGIVYVRSAAGRVLWRDLHAVTGVWVSLFALFFLISGLPWATLWGGLLKDAQAVRTRATVQQDWSTGSGSELAERIAASAPPPSSAMASMPDMASPSRVGSDVRNLDRMVASVARLHLAPPVLISPPSAATPTWTGRSDAQDRPLRVTVTLDPATGSVVTRKGFEANSLVDRFVAVGVAAHEGQLFGILNEVLDVLVAMALTLVVISAVVLWWTRRPASVLGAPRSLDAPRYSPFLLAAIALLGVALPLFGSSLLVVLILERSVLRRVRAVRIFLGLTSPQMRSN